MVNITEATSAVNEEFSETLKSLEDGERYWNYRVVKRASYYGIYEVHYCKGGKVEFISENPVMIDADSKESVKWILRMMQANWVLPTIDYDTLEEIDDII
jgi:hypothetical protein